MRFAETDGFEYDTHRNDAWRYRDYVIRAFNNDKPYDRFITEQLAGDEIAPKEDETLIASGFNRLGPLRKNAGNQEVASSRNEVLTEMTNVVGAAMLGVTLGCARCHDHKFDPFRQSDYYRIQAYFAGVYDNDVSRATPEEQAAWNAKAKPVEDEMAKLRGQMAALRGMKDPAALDKREAITKQLEELQDKMPPPLPSVHTRGGHAGEALSDQSAGARRLRGEGRSRGHAAARRAACRKARRNCRATTERPRAELAKWIVDPENPLTARVMVNRIWEYHFGSGIVATPNDFGRMGARPTHPELLDYLANEFVAHGYSVKHMHRLILNSNTYRQSSAPPANPACKGARDGEGSGQPAAVAIQPPAPGCRGNSRRDALGFGTVECQGRRTQRDDSHRPGTGQRALQAFAVGAGERPGRIRPPQRLSDRQAQFAAALHGGLRCAGRAGELPAARIQHACAAGAGADERRPSPTSRPMRWPRAWKRKPARTCASRSISAIGWSPAGRPGRRKCGRRWNFSTTQPKREFALTLFNLNSFLYVN